MTHDTHQTVSDTLVAPPQAPFNTTAIFADLYETHLHPVAKKHVTISKLFSGPSLPVVKMLGHMTEEEYRRHIRGIFARANALALAGEAQMENQKANDIQNGVNRDIAERLHLSPDASGDETPVTCTKTGSVYIPQYRSAEPEPTSEG